MKTLTFQKKSLLARRGVLGILRGTALSTLLVAGVALLGPGSVFRAAAQFPALGDPAKEFNEQTFSMGAFQVVVDPSFYNLMNAGLGGSTLNYPGWNPANGTLTSPVLFDEVSTPNSGTYIAVSPAHLRARSFNAAEIATGYDTVGNAANTATLINPAASPTDQILGYAEPSGCTENGQYYFGAGYPDPTVPPNWDFQGINTFDEILTEIQQFNLTLPATCIVTDPRAANITLPLPAGASPTMVRAGFGNLYNGPLGVPIGNYLRPSIGMVQANQTTGDFPATSFFDIYPEISLPPIPNTPGVIFPFWGAVLTNGPALIPGTTTPFTDSCGYPIPGPLIVASALPTTLPPNGIFTNSGSGIVYIHGQSQSQLFGVGLYFRDANPPYWNAGQFFGTVSLAGHGIFADPCVQTTFPAVTTFMDLTFGPVGAPLDGATVGSLYSDSHYPNSNSVYVSKYGTNFGGSSIDVLLYTNGPTVTWIRDFNVGNLINPITLPTIGSSAVYTNTNAVVSFDISENGSNFVTAQATGTATVLLNNTANYPSVGGSVYSAQLTSFNVSGVTGFGSARFRVSPTKPGTGKHVVQSGPSGQGPFRIGGSVSTTIQYSANGGLSYQDPGRPQTWVEQPIVDCGSVAPVMSIVQSSPTTATITWNSANYQLQGCNSLVTSPWTTIASGSPYVFNTTAPTFKFYRLICPPPSL